MAKWYVLRTEPRSEYLATDELTKDGYEIFFPRVAAVSPRLGREDEPLFPGYLFIRWEITGQGLPTFRPAHRVAGWLNFGGTIPSIPGSDVSRLQERIEEIDHRGGIWHSYQTGEHVRVVSRQFDCLAQVTEQPKSAKGRVRVLLDFMGRLVPTEVPWNNLRPIDDVPDAMESIIGQNSAANAKRTRRTRGKGRWVQGLRSQPVGGGSR
jgi:transcriptional antiterminator RfaH